MAASQVSTAERGTMRSSTKKCSGMWAAVASLVIGFALLAAPSLAGGQGPDPTDIAAGMRIYRQKGDCQSCHGWAADGRKMDNQMPDGANLRQSKLDRTQLIQVIKCGRPGRSMPAFDRLAYTDDRCNGITKADLQKSKLTLPDPAATLQPREIEALVDFLEAKVINKGPMDRAKCIEYWGSDVEVCSEFPN
jgi:mono/diheme cytochrome c family protein